MLCCIFKHIKHGSKIFVCNKITIIKNIDQNKIYINIMSGLLVKHCIQIHRLCRETVYLGWLTTRTQLLDIYFLMYTKKNFFTILKQFKNFNVHFNNQVFFCFFFSESVVSYVAPRADTEFEDISYDGDLARSLMTGGLGMLTDSLYGADDFLQFDLQFHKPLSEYYSYSRQKRTRVPISIKVKTNN